MDDILTDQFDPSPTTTWVFSLVRLESVSQWWLDTVYTTVPNTVLWEKRLEGLERVLDQTNTEYSVERGNHTREPEPESVGWPIKGDRPKENWVVRPNRRGNWNEKVEARTDR